MKYYKSTELEIGEYYYIEDLAYPGRFIIVRYESPMMQNEGPKRRGSLIDYTRINGSIISDFNSDDGRIFYYSTQGCSIENRLIRKADADERLWLEESIKLNSVAVRPYTLTIITEQLRKEYVQNLYT